jgi:hypothetical protein
MIGCMHRKDNVCKIYLYPFEIWKWGWWIEMHGIRNGWALCLETHRAYYRRIVHLITCLKQVMQEQVNSLILHTVHILKTTLAHTTGFTEWFITHPFYLNIMNQGRSLMKAACEMRWSWLRYVYGLHPIMAMCIFLLIFGYVLWYFERVYFSWWCVLGSFVTLIPLPSWSFGFIFDWVVYGWS